MTESAPLQTQEQLDSMNAFARQNPQTQEWSQPTLNYANQPLRNTDRHTELHDFIAPDAIEHVVVHQAVMTPNGPQLGWLENGRGKDANGVEHVDMFRDDERMTVSAEQLQKAQEFMNARTGKRLAETALTGSGIIDSVPGFEPEARPVYKKPDIYNRISRAELRALTAQGLESQPVQDVKETAATQLAKLMQGLSEKDRSALRGFTEAQISKRQAQNDNDGRNSEYWGQVAGRHNNDLSEVAKQVRSRYEELYKQQ